MRLFAISDLHLGFAVNRRALERLRPHPEDWLILAGDVGETPAHLEFAFQTLTPRFERLIWVPGNHELWTRSNRPNPLRGVALYERLVELCRSYGVVTPEDQYPVWPGSDVKRPTIIAPLYLLYDYSFRPDDVPAERALDWAAEARLVCADEQLLHPDPYASREEWCDARVRATAERLARVPDDHSLILVNHFPLRRDLARLPAIPRFSIWCGTRQTEDWHTRFRATVVISGHLHIRGTRWRDGVRFKEVSLGYPRQWKPDRGIEPYLRQILPEPEEAFSLFSGAAASW